MTYDQIYFMGTGRVGGACLQILAEACVSVPIVYLSAEMYAIPTVENQCRRMGIPYLRMAPRELREYLLQQEAKILLLSAHNAYIFPREVVEKENFTIINFHNAYLPDYRGRNAPTWEIYHQEVFGGATWHLVASAVDTGNILVQEKVPIQPDDTALSLLMKSAACGVDLLRKHIDEFLQEECLPQETRACGRLYLSTEVPNGGFYDFDWDLSKGYAFLRSMDYRGLPIMPIPRIRLEDGIYEIEDYAIEKCTAGGGQTSFVLAKQDGRRLVCRLRELGSAGR